MPDRIDRAGRRDQRRRRVRRDRRRRSTIPHSFGSRASLRALHAAARRDDVLPRVRTAARTRQDVVEVLGRCCRSTGTGGRRARRRPGATAARSPGTGTRTKCTSRITVGTGTIRRSERNSAPLRWTISAFSFSTSTTARRDETTQSGSKLALSRSARATESSPPVRRQSVPARGARFVATSRCEAAGRWRGRQAAGAAPFEVPTTSAADGCAPGRTRSRAGTARYDAVGHREKGRPPPPPRAARTGTIGALRYTTGAARTTSAPAHVEPKRGACVMPGSPRFGSTPGRYVAIGPAVAWARDGSPWPGRPRRRSTTVQVAPRPEQSFKDLFDALAAQIETRAAGQAPRGAPVARVPVLRRPPPDRGRPRRRQDVARQGDRPLDRRLVAPHPVHPRPAAVRRHRRVGLGPRPQRLRVPSRRRVRERRARRRDQPRVAEDAVGAARVDGGTSGHRRRARPTSCRSRSWSSRRRTRSSSKAPTRCPRRSSTGSCCGCASATPTATPSSRSSTRTARATIDRPTSSSRSPTPRPSRCGSKELARIHVAPELQGYIVDLADATRHHRDLMLGVSPRGALALQRASRALAASIGRAYVVPDDVKALAPSVLEHRLVLSSGSDDARRRARPTSSASVLDCVPVPANRQD